MEMTRQIFVSATGAGAILSALRPEESWQVYLGHKDARWYLIGPTITLCEQWVRRLAVWPGKTEASVI